MIHALPVNPSDTQDLPAVSKWLSFANTGLQTLHITTVAGEDVPGIVMASGQWMIEARRVWQTGTTVTNIIEWWIG